MSALDPATSPAQACHGASISIAGCDLQYAYGEKIRFLVYCDPAGCALGCRPLFQFFAFNIGRWAVPVLAVFMVRHSGLLVDLAVIRPGRRTYRHHSFEFQDDRSQYADVPPRRLNNRLCWGCSEPRGNPIYGSVPASRRAPQLSLDGTGTRCRG